MPFAASDGRRASAARAHVHAGEAGAGERAAVAGHCPRHGVPRHHHRQVLHVSCAEPSLPLPPHGYRYTTPGATLARGSFTITFHHQVDDRTYIT